MRRVAVIGCGGLGKTTLARELAERAGLPVVHADFVVYRNGERPRPEPEWQAELARLAGGERWVIDAMKLSTLAHRVERADTVVFLDLPRRSCYAGLLRRRLRYRGLIDRERGIADRISLGLLRWIWRFRRDVRPHVLELLADHDSTTRIVVLGSRREARVPANGCGRTATVRVGRGRPRRRRTGPRRTRPVPGTGRGPPGHRPPG